MEKRPISFIAGEQDPLCAAPALYRFAAQAGGATRVSIVGGDHGFSDPKVTGTAGAELTQKNVRIVAELAADFMLASLLR